MTQGEQPEMTKGKTEVQKVVDYAMKKALRERIRHEMKKPEYAARIQILEENDHLAYK